MKHEVVPQMKHTNCSCYGLKTKFFDEVVVIFSELIQKNFLVVPPAFFKPLLAL